MITLLMTMAIGLANTWTETSPTPFAIKTTLGPTTLFGGDRDDKLIYVCPVSSTVQADGDAVDGCLASDVGVRTTSDSRFVCETVLIPEAVSAFDVDMMYTYLKFIGPYDTTTGLSYTNPSFPSYIDCDFKPQPVSNPSHIHRIRTTLTDAPNQPRFAAMDVSSKTWTTLTGTGLTFSFPVGWPTGMIAMYVVNIPNGTFVGNSTLDGGANLSTTAGGGTTKPGILCEVLNGTNDLAIIAMQKGMVAAGPGYCKANDGTVRHIKITAAP